MGTKHYRLSSKQNHHNNAATQKVAGSDRAKSNAVQSIDKKDMQMRDYRKTMLGKRSESFVPVQRTFSLQANDKEKKKK